ncbi:hypothetical protein OSTOST_05217 [Ostertagia ostertagi]
MLRDLRQRQTRNDNYLHNPLTQHSKAYKKSADLPHITWLVAIRRCLSMRRLRKLVISLQAISNFVFHVLSFNGTGRVPEIDGQVQGELLGPEVSAYIDEKRNSTVKPQTCRMMEPTRTDHAALKSLNERTNVALGVLRWALEVQRYDPTVQFDSKRGCGRAI